VGRNLWQTFKSIIDRIDFSKIHFCSLDIYIFALDTMKLLLAMAAALLPVVVTGFSVATPAWTTTNTRRSFSLAATVVSEMTVDGKTVRVFDGDYASAVVDLVKTTATAAIAAKGSFSLAIPGGSVVTALAGLSPDDFDMDKVHIFFCNERIGANKCYQGALDAFAIKCNIPLDQVYQVPELDSPAASADAYAQMMVDCVAVDSSNANMPSVDLILLGTGDDGHCGSLYPNSAEIKATGQGKIVLPIDEGDKKSIAVSMDFMNAAKTVLVSAAEAKRAPMVAKALTGDFDEWDCPAGLVQSVAGETLWFVDVNSIAEYNKVTTGAAVE
jgi:6-phosphogluconolactonase